MSNSLAGPTVAGAISGHSQRIDRVERRLRNPTGEFKPEVQYSYSGELDTATSPITSFAIPQVAYALVAHLAVAGSSSTVVRFRKNGSTVATITLASGITRLVLPLSVYYAGLDQDTASFDLSTAGTGAETLTVIARFRHAPTV